VNGLNISGCNSGRLIPILVVLLQLSLGCADLSAQEQPVTATANNKANPLSATALPPLQAFDEVIKRPLFYANRKPRPTSTGPTGGNEQQLRLTWKLTGITITGVLTQALFQQRNGDKRLRLEVGMPLDDHWQLEEVNIDSVTVTSGDQLVQMILRQPRESQATGEEDNKAPAKRAQDTDSTTSGRKSNSVLESAPQRGKLQTM
jgi:hypothetical protein